MRRTWTALGLVAALAVAGCGDDGGGSSDSDQAKQTAENYMHALGSDDYKKACTQLSPQAQTELSSAAGQEVAKLKTASCETIFKSLLGAPNPRGKQALKDAKATSATITGTKATVKLEGANRDVPLEKIDGSWRITSLGFNG